MTRLIFTILTILSVLTAAAAAPATAEAVEGDEQVDGEPEVPVASATFDSIGIRAGFLLNTMLVSDLPIAFRYFDLGVRYKSGEYYVDVRAPALTLIADGLVTLLTIRWRRNPEPLLMVLNHSEIATHWELAHARLGYRFRIVPPGDFELWKNDLEAAVGFFATADLIFFERRARLQRDDARSLGYMDPFVPGVGGFLALGRTHQRLQYDVALGIGQAVGAIDTSQPRPVTLFLVDGDFQYALGWRNLDFYVRPRLTMYYTDLDPAMHYGAGLTAGLNLGF